MELKKIKEIFNFEKGSLQSTKCVPGEYKFITASSDWKTHNSFDYDCEALVVAVAASGSLGRVHYINDKFISSDLCFILTPKDSKKFPVDLKFYYSIFKSVKEDLVKRTATGTSKQAINRINFGNYLIPYYSIKQQEKLAPVFKKLANEQEELYVGAYSQRNIVEKLKQIILQEAIEGKLTSSWRKKNKDVESVDKLIKKITQHKKQLIKDGKIKAGKKQKSNNIEGLYFQLPTEWIYADMDDITEYITDGTHQTPRYTDEGRIFLSAQNIKPFKFIPVPHKFISEKDFKEYNKNKKPEKGDLLVGRVGSKGETAVIDQDLDFAFYVSLGFIKTFKQYTSPEYLTIVMNSQYGNKYATGNMSSTGASAGNFNLGRIRSFPVPFPPLSEQIVIVKKVKELMQKFSIVDNKIKNNEENIKILTLAVLKEAFID